MRLIPSISVCLVTLYSQTGMAAELANSNIPTTGHFSMSLGANYDSGDYGDSIDTNVWSTPIGLKYRIGLWSFGISTSFLRVNGPNSVDADGNFIGGGGAKTTEQGIGDTFLSTTYNLLDNRNYAVGLDVKGSLKIPTANEKKFLGSGKTDFGLSAEAYKTFNSWTPYLNVGYKWKGSPDNIDYNNIWTAGLGFDYAVNRDLILGASYDWQQKVTKFSDNAKEGSVYANYYVNDNNKVNVYLLSGFSDASPNWGTGVTLVHYF